jgi:chromosome segregation ATPase
MPMPLTDHDLHLLELAAAKLPLPEAERFRWQDLLTAHREALRDLDEAAEALDQAESRISDLEEEVSALREEVSEKDAVA